MAGWNSAYWELTYQILGWSAFISWSLSFYPQTFLNIKRKSVVGLSFDFLVFNITKHSSYLIYNAVLYFSPVVQRQYHDKYGPAQMIPVAANDVAFSTHAVLLTIFKLYQVLIYDAIMNFRLKSTTGWSVGNVTLDLLGGVLNFGQMSVQSIDQGTWVNFYGNIGKTLISLETVFFDLIFLLQHYVLYPEKKGSGDPGALEDSISPLMEEQEIGQEENSCV